MNMRISLAQSGATSTSNRFKSLSELSRDSPDVHDQLEFPNVIESHNCPQVTCPIIPKDKGFKTATQRSKRNMSKGQSRVTNPVDVEDDQEDRVAAIDVYDGPRRATDVAFSAQELCVAFPLHDGPSPDKVDHALDQTRTSLQDVSALGGPDKVDHALDDHARTSLQHVSALCGMCNDECPPLVPIGGCGKTCCNGSDSLMPDMVFDAPDEFALPAGAERICTSGNLRCQWCCTRSTDVRE